MDAVDIASLMVDMAEIMLVIYLFIFFRVKYVLQGKGYEVAWFSLSRRQFSDYGTLNTVIKMEQDEVELRKLVFYRRLTVFSWPLLTLATGLLLTGWYAGASW